MLALLPATLAAQWLASLLPAAVERLYSRAVYRVVRAALGGLTGWVPFSLAECLLLALVAGALYVVPSHLPWRTQRWRRHGPLNWIGVALTTVLAVAGAAYAAFLAGWGLNHQRLPLASSAGLSPSPSSRDELRALSGELIASANALREGLTEDAHGVMRLPQGRAGALRAAHEGLERAAARVPALSGPRVRVKQPILSPVLSWLGISGIFIPFTGEAHVNATLPDVDVPFAASHELAHQRGLAREDEANYAASLACRLHPRPEFRYSGTLLSSAYVQAALAAEDRGDAAALEAGRSGAVQRDLRAMAEWSLRYRSRLTEASQRVNDAYLKSQGQELGVKSYGAMVDLLLAERRRGG